MNKVILINIIILIYNLSYIIWRTNLIL